MMLREYQQRAIDQLYSWFESGGRGNPCLVLPTGSGKSHIVAALCKDALQNWPETRVLMITHVKELIEQNAEKMRLHWPGAPMGIYSASIGKKQLGEPITFAGIQSVRSKALDLGHIDLVIIDECFTGETRVCTPSGQKRIDQVRCGDVVYNQAGMGVVEAISCKPSFDIYRVETSNRKLIECTANHPFFTSKGWVKAKDLEPGSRLFSKQDMSALWQQFPSLGEIQRGRKSQVSNARKSLEEANLLLREVCKEIKPNILECASEGENKQEIERDKAQAYKAWRERAIAAFATAGASPCSGRRVGSGGSHKDGSGPQERRLPQLLQGGHWQQGDENSDRTGRRKPFISGEAGTGQEKDSEALGVRVVRVSCIKRESATPVYNLQVNGHPSYFAEGVAVHNCHLVNHKDEGGYRQMLKELTAINPALRVVGLTATPYRLGHGMITDKPALFDDLIEPVSIDELIFKGYLATLRSKVTKAKMDTTGVHKRGGEFIESELQAVVDTKDNNQRVVREVIELAGERKAWLFFCTGVKHANNVAEVLRQQGISAECVTGETPKKERERMLADFKAGRLRALTNANVLTTGFDYPDIDLIAMMRPTMSASLYVQMAGRGMRVKSHTDHCLVLDFAGVVETHGPITNVQPPKKGGDGNGEAPVKVCDNCDELVHISAMACPACGHAFPEPEKKKLELRNDDIMGLEGKDLDVTAWNWRKHTSRSTGKEMLAVTYYGALSDKPITEYLPVLHDGYAGQRAMQQLFAMANSSGANLAEAARLDGEQGLDYLSVQMSNSTPPKSIEYRLDGKFHRVLKRSWT